MKLIRPDLWQTSRFSPFPGVNFHAYVLQDKTNGNSLFYGLGNTEEFDAMKELGGISYNFLTHRHEASAMTKQVRDTFKSKLVCDAAEASVIGSFSKVDRVAQLEGTTTFENGVIGIPSPGHTEGGYSYLYKSPVTGEKYLFIGDIYFLVPSGEFKTFVFAQDGGDPMKLIDTLKELRKYEPDLVICSGFQGEVGFTEMSPEKWRDGIDENIELLEKM